MELLLATNVVLDPIVRVLSAVLLAIDHLTHNFGWALVLLALSIKVVLWPLNSMQYRSIAQMQVLQPKLKALQAKYKGDPPRLNQETMALYKEHGANPFASCLPLLLQMPILFSLYWAIIANKGQFVSATWAWIGSPISFAAHALPFPLLAKNLSEPDYLLLGLYVISMYFSVRFSSPAMDEQQAQQQKMMALVSPVMIAFVGRYWPSALILYWLTFNVLSMAQQWYLMRRFPRTAAVAVTAPAAEAALSTTPRVAANGRAALGRSPEGSAPSRRRKRSAPMKEDSMDDNAAPAGDDQPANPRAYGQRRRAGLGSGARRGPSTSERRPRTPRPERPAQVASAEPEDLKPAKTLLVEILHRMGIEQPEVRYFARPEGEYLEVMAPDLAGLIGRHGHTLEALNLVFNNILNAGVKKDRRYYTIDAEGYRARRADVLRGVALQSLERAMREKRAIELEPMLPSERKIVHLALAENPYVTTESSGAEPERRVVVSPRA